MLCRLHQHTSHSRRLALSSGGATKPLVKLELAGRLGGNGRRTRSAWLPPEAGMHINTLGVSRHDPRNMEGGAGRKAATPGRVDSDRSPGPLVGPWGTAPRQHWETGWTMPSPKWERAGVFILRPSSPQASLAESCLWGERAPLQVLACSGMASAERPAAQRSNGAPCTGVLYGK